MSSRRYDVAILGSGMGGAMLACILAKRGISTLLLEEASHPRFAIGESLIPETGIRLRILAEKYGVPEIGWIGNFYALRNNVSAACGVKRSFSFMYHRKGERHRAEETNQLPTLTPPFGPDSHLFRQDTDAFLASMAVHYGATLRQQTRVERIDFGADEVELATASGEKFRASFLVDASGMKSLVSTQLGLRDAVPRFRTDTRALYTHVIGLKPADWLFDSPGSHGLPSPLGQATMHHVFDGGWIWIIPFNNHRDSTNPLTSVGLMLDRRKFPQPSGAPEEEFKSIISAYPTIARHFADARAVRPWIATGRLQYSSPHLLGPRVLQLPHAADFVDPLYSSGLSVLTVAIDMIAGALFDAVAANDYAIERFQPIEDVVNRGFDHYDMIVSRSFDAFASYDLWNAWNRNWVMGNVLGTFGPLALLVRYLASGDRRILDKTSELARIGVLSNHLPEVLEIMRSSGADVDAAIDDKISHAEASRRIFERMSRADFLPPHMGFGKAEQHAPASFTLMAGARHVLWFDWKAPAKWREYCSFPLTTYAAHAFAFAFAAVGEALARAWRGVRDVFAASNGDWRFAPPALKAHTIRYDAIPDTADPAAVRPAETAAGEGPVTARMGESIAPLARHRGT